MVHRHRAARAIWARCVSTLSLRACVPACLPYWQGDSTKVVFLYGNRSVRDILMREQLDEWAATHSERFTMVYVVGAPLDT
jgi:hypothetical protein